MHACCPLSLHSAVPRDSRSLPCPLVHDTAPQRVRRRGIPYGHSSTPYRDLRPTLQRRVLTAFLKSGSLSRGIFIIFVTQHVQLLESKSNAVHPVLKAVETWNNTDVH